MIVEIPFVYTASVVPPGKRNPRVTHVLDRVPIRILTAPEGEMPVAFRFSPGQNVPLELQQDELAALNEALAMELRWDGEGLWAPHGHTFGRDVAAAVAANAGRLTEADASQQIVSMSRTPFASTQWDGLMEWKRRDVVPIGRLEGRIQADDRRGRVADILALARKVRFHDGRFWVPAEEPCWTGVGGLFPRVRAELAAEFRLKSPSTIWRADRLVDALGDLDNQRTRGDHPAMAEGMIEILLPEAVRLRIDETQLVSAARGTIACMKDMLPGASMGLFAVYAELRDAAAEAPPDTVPERLAEAVAVMLSRPESREAETGNRHWLFQDLETAERRWIRSLSAPAPTVTRPGGGPGAAFGR